VVKSKLKGWLIKHGSARRRHPVRGSTITSWAIESAAWRSTAWMSS
jgi:hypothetical protein